MNVFYGNKNIQLLDSGAAGENNIGEIVQWSEVGILTIDSKQVPDL